MNDLDQLGGTLWIRPGRPRPHNLRSTRPDWVERITHGRLASSLPTTVGSLFTLCSHAHVLCAGMAVDAALGRTEPVSAAARARLAMQTLREHAQRLWLDWPQLLAAAPASEPVVADAARVLARCPLFAPLPVRSHAAHWLEANAIGMPLVPWLAAWESDPATSLQAWSEQAPGSVAQLLRDCRSVASTPLPAVPALRVHADASSLRALASCVRDEGFSRQPRWQGECAETGAWTRLHDSAPQRLPTPWLRLGARLAEAVRLALPDEAARCGASWLDLGALPLGDGEAIAWVEMARGLLVHHVQLDGHGDTARVAACHVIAPTEWNFHPDGAMARAVERLGEQPSAEGQRQLDVLIAVFDPCVRVELEPQGSAVHEADHA